MTGTPAPAASQRRRLHGDSGSNLVEYSMLLALIVVVCLSAMNIYAKATADKTNCVQSATTNEVGGLRC